MCISKQKLKLFWIFFAIISLIAFIICFILSVLEKNGSYVYSWLITMPFIVVSKYIYLIPFKKMYSENNHRSKKKEIFVKFILLHIASSVVFMMPFFIVSVVLLVLNQITYSYIFNIWVTLSLTITFIIIWITMVSVFSYNTKKNSNRSYDKEKIDG